MPRLRAEQKIAIAASYRAGKSLGVLGKEYGRHPSSIARVLENLCVPRRTVGDAIRATAKDRGLSSRRFSPAEEQAIKARYKAGESADAIGEDLGADSSVVIRIVVRNGGTVRKGNLTPSRQQRQEDVIADYLAGMTLEEVAAKHHLSDGWCSDLLAKYKVPARDHGKLTPENRDEVARRYMAGESTTALSIEFGIHPGSIRNLVITRGGHAVNPTGRPVIYQADHEALDRPSKERDYIVGLYITDGCVLERDRAISIGFSGGDGHHLEQVRAFFKANNPIVWNDPPAERSQTILAKQAHARLTIYSGRLYEAALRFGVAPRKSLTAAVIGLENSAAFWHGAIDGDGDITTGVSGQPRIRLCGASLRFLEQFKAFACREVGEGQSGILTQLRPELSDRPLYSYSLSGVRAVALLRILYESCSIALPRKLALAREGMQWAPKNRRSRLVTPSP